MPGVIDFISAADLGPANQTPAVLTPERKTLAGRKILAEVGPDKPGVEFWGQALGIILADSKEHAEFAAQQNAPKDPPAPQSQPQRLHRAQRARNEPRRAF